MTENQPIRKPMYTESPIRVKAYEVDVMGIVSNIVYVKWFEDLRHKILDNYYPFTDMIKDGKSPMLMKTEVEYKKPLTIMDNPVGRLWFSKMGLTKWEITLQICVGDVVHCQGRQTGCFYDIASGKPVPFPQWFVDMYNKENS